MNITDNELRGIVLKKYYERRRERGFQWKKEDFDDLNEKIEFDDQDLFSICRQLGEHNLIKWRPVDGRMGKLLGGMGEITALGIDVIEGKSCAPIAVELNNQYITNNITAINGFNIIGNNNTINAQFGDLYKALETLQEKVNNSNEFTPAEKQDVRSELDTLKAQLAKSKPDKSRIMQAWECVDVLLKGKDIYNMITTITPLLSVWFNSM